MAGLPEVLRVRLIGSGDHHVFPRLHVRRLGCIKKLCSVHAFEIKREAAFRSIDFKTISVSAAYSETACFKTANTGILESRENLDCVIYFPTRNKDVEGSTELDDLAVQPDCCIEGMRQKVT